jgi:16S rRNA processing protein RimM
MESGDRIQLGVVGKPHGVRGTFHLDGCIDAPALVPGLVLLIGDREFTLTARGGVDERPLVTLEEVNDRAQIALLRGQPVRAARGDLTALASDEWFADDLIGMSVVDEAGNRLGEIVRMVNLPSVDVLEVETTEGSQLQLPMVRDAIIAIEPGTGVTVDAKFLDLA